MPIYEIEAPDGRIFEIEGPPNAKPESLFKFVQQQIRREQREKYYAEPEAPPVAAAPPPAPTLGGQAKEFIKGIPAGLVGTLGTAAEGVAALLPESLEKPVVEKTRDIVSALTPEAAPGYEDSVGRKLGQALGSVGSFVLPGTLATKAAGAVAGLGTAAGLGAAAGAGEARQRAEMEGATPEEKSSATALGAGVGLTEIFPAKRLLRFLDEIPGVKQQMVNRLIEIGKTAGVEAAQEAAAGFGQNLIAKGIYKPEQELIEGLGEQAAYGGAAGAMADVLMNLAFGKRAQPAPKQPTSPAAPTEAAPVEPTAPEYPEGIADMMAKPLPTTVVDAYYDYAVLKEMSKSFDSPEVKQRLETLKELRNELLADEKARGKTDPKKVRAQLAEVGIDLGETAGITRGEAYEAFGARTPVQGEFREVMGDIAGPTSFQRPITPEETPREPEVEGIAPTTEEYDQYRQSLLLGQEIKRLRALRRDAVTKEEKDAISKKIKQYEEAYKQSRAVGVETEFAPQVVEGQLPLAPRAAPETLLNEETLAGLGLPKRSGYYKQLLGKDVSKPEDAATVRAVIEKAKTNTNLAPETIASITALEEKFFAATETTQGQEELAFETAPTEPKVVKTKKAKAAKPAEDKKPDETEEVEVEETKPAEDEGDAINFFLTEDEQALIPGYTAQGFTEQEAIERILKIKERFKSGKPTQEKPAESAETEEVEVEETTEPLTEKSAFDPEKRVFVGAFSRGAGRWPRTMRDVTFQAQKAIGLPEDASPEQLWNAFREPKNQAKIEKYVKRKFGQTFDFYVSAARPKEVRPARAPSGVARVLTDIDLLARAVLRGVAEQDSETLPDNPSLFIVKQAGRRAANGLLSNNQQKINEGWTDFLTASNSSVKEAIKRMAADIYFNLEPDEDGIPEGTGKKAATFLKKTLKPNGKKLFDKYTKQFEEQDRKAKGFTRAYDIRQKSKQAEEEENLSFEEAEALDRAEMQREERKAEKRAVRKKVEPYEVKKVPEWLQPSVERRDGRVVFLKDNIALIEGFDKETGDPFFKGFKRTENGDVFTHTGEILRNDKNNLFTPEEFSALLEARAATIKRIEAELKKNPDGPFVKDSLVFGEDVSPELQEIAKGWVQQLGLTDARIVFATKASAKAIAQSQYGRFHRIGRSSLTGEGTYGYMQPLGGKDYAITIPSSGSTLKTLEVLAHELGHIAERLAYANAPKAVKDQIKKEFEDWARANRKGMMRDYVNAMRPYRVAKQTAVAEGMVASDAPQFNSYWNTFSEWFADQTAKWATTQEKPLGVVEKFFKRLADKLKSFFTGEREKFLPNKTVAQWLNSLSENVPPIGRKDVGTLDGQSMKDPVEEADSFISAMGVSPTAGKADPGLLTKLKDFVTDPQYRNQSIDWFRANVVYKGAAVERKAQDAYNNAVADALGALRPDISALQAEHSDDIGAKAMLKGGMELNKNGYWQAVNKDSSMSKVFSIIDGLGQKLGDKEKAFQIAHGAFLMRRANTLKAKDIIPIQFTQDQINAGLKAFEAYPELNEAFDAFTEFKNGMIDAMVQGGRLSKDQAQQWKDAIDYVPWNRIKEYEDEIYTSPQAYFRGLTNLRSMKKLKGGEDEINNVFDNMIGLSFWMANSAIRNHAAIKLTDFLASLGDARRVYQGQGGVNKANLINIYRDGELQTYELDSPVDVLAFKGTESIAVPVLGAFANFLRKTTTSMPAFAVSQLFQDSYRSMTNSGLQNPFSAPAAILQNFAKELKGDELTEKLASYGIIGAYDLVPGQAREQIEKKLGLIQQNAFQKGWDALEKFSLASDGAQRRALYEQTLKETGDEQLALYRAMEIINFKRQGASKTVGILRQIVPFFNAYLQGMDVLYRTMSGRGLAGKERAEAVNLFWKTGIKLAALSTIYAMLVSGDDEYEELRGYEKDRNFIFPGTNVKIPIAPEIGFMFKVIPERTYHYIMSQGTDSPDDATKLMKGLRDGAIDSFTGPNITPQFFKPLLEVTTNYSFFTQSPIVGRGQEGKTAYTQFTANTSEIAKILGELGNLVVDGGVSPLKIDYLMRAYTGIAGGTVLAISDELIAGSERPAKNWYELPQIRTFAYDQIGGGLKEDFYDFRDKVTQVNNTINDLSKQGRYEALQDYMTESRLNLLMYKSYVYQIEQSQERIRSYKKFIQADKTLEDKEKLKRINELDKAENEMLKNIRDIRKKAGL